MQRNRHLIKKYVKMMEGLKQIFKALFVQYCGVYPFFSLMYPTLIVLEIVCYHLALNTCLVYMENS